MLHHAPMLGCLSNVYISTPRESRLPTFDAPESLWRLAPAHINTNIREDSC
jgi:hypothetical protein